MLAGAIVLVAAAAVAFSVLQQKEYTATSSLLFSDTQFDQELFGSNFTTDDAEDPTTEQATNLDLASLPIVLQRTRQALKSQGGLDGSSISVAGIGQSDIVQVNATGPDPVRAALVANTYAQQFVLYRQQADRSKITAAQTLVNNEIKALPASQRYGSVGTSLQNRANELGVLAALQTGNAEVAQPASVPSSPSSPDTKRNAALGVLLGLLLGMALVFISERLDRRIRGAAELEAAYGMPILGVVPESREYEHAGTAPLPPIEAEAFALLRARLRYFNVDREIGSLLLTSSFPGEGKTTVALNLALAEAFAGNRKVLLLEADLRRPSLANRLGLNSGPGLAEILSQNATLDSALQTITVPSRSERQFSFSVIPAGATPPNPAELMESRAMIDLLSAVTDRFGLVIIDTAPTTAVSDAIPLLRLVSGVIVVNRVDVVTRDAARGLKEQLHKLAAPVLGIVANAVVPQGRDGYGYGYGYGYVHATSYLTDGEQPTDESFLRLHKLDEHSNGASSSDVESETERPIRG